uniref:Phosphofurin acidic cluster sorting protein 1/2 C-terminal domain-containing protein n=1 Tax=Myotis lucifugus TaxID=59463 RepID=G1PZ25_MYOLU
VLVSTPPAPPPTLVPRFNTPMPKNLFATRELDSPSLRFVPRLHLTLMKMVVFQELEKDLISMVIAMKMQRSNLISMVITVKMQGSNEQLETDLGLTSLQDPHFLCEKATSYRSCCTVGKKILPVGAIHMAEVGQVAKVAEEAFAKVTENWICSLSNQPIHWEDCAIQDRCKAKSRVNYSEGVYQRFSSEQQAGNYATYGPDLSQEGIDMGMLKKQRPWIVGKTSIIRPQNIKEKVVACLGKFKVLEGCGLEQDTAEHVPELEWDLDLLFNTLQNPRDSGPDMEDDNSTLSTPKPKLRLFFEGLAHSSSQTEMEASTGPGANRKTRGPSEAVTIESHNKVHDKQKVVAWLSRAQVSEEDLDPEQDLTDHVPEWRRTRTFCLTCWRTSDSSPDREEDDSLLSTTKHKLRPYCEGLSHKQNKLKCPRRPSSGSNSQTPRKTTYNQLNHILISDDQLPENIILVNTDDTLQGQMLPVLCTCFMADILVAFSSIIWQIQRYCNNNSQPPKPVKILVAGAQHYFIAVLRVFLELLSYKLLNWLGYVHFLVILLGSNPVARYLGSIHYRYTNFFQDLGWWDLFHKLEAHSTIQDTLDIVTRITQYITGTTVPPSCPSRKPCSPTSRRAPMRSPYSSFFSGRQVKVGIVQQSSGTSGDSDDGPTMRLCHPTHLVSEWGMSSPRQGNGAKLMEGQVDYWTAAQPTDRKRDSKKKDLLTANNTLKCTIQSLQDSRLPSSGQANATPTMCMAVLTKEKKKKVLFLPKKTKDKVVEKSKSQCLEGISHLVCRAKNQENILRSSSKVWCGMKFFHLAAQGPS